METELNAIRKANEDMKCRLVVSGRNGPGSEIADCVDRIDFLLAEIDRLKAVCLCAWCPDPRNPLPEYHPNGHPEHHQQKEAGL